MIISLSAASLMCFINIKCWLQAADDFNKAETVKLRNWISTLSSKKCCNSLACPKNCCAGGAKSDQKFGFAHCVDNGRRNC